MTRTEYLALAHALYAVRPIPAPNVERTAEIRQWKRDCVSIGQMLGSRTSDFDKERFLLNCESGDDTNL